MEMTRKEIVSRVLKNKDNWSVITRYKHFEMTNYAADKKEADAIIRNHVREIVRNFGLGQWEYDEETDQLNEVVVESEEAETEQS